MKILLLLAGAAFLIGGHAAQSQPSDAGAQMNGAVSCPMAGSGSSGQMMGTGMNGRSGMPNMQEMHQQMLAMDSQMHNDMQAMSRQMAAMHDEMHAMHGEMMRMQGAPKRH